MLELLINGIMYNREYIDSVNKKQKSLGLTILLLTACVGLLTADSKNKNTRINNLETQLEELRMKGE